MSKLLLKYKIKLKNIRGPWKKFQKSNNYLVINKAVETEKNPKLIKIGPTFIPEYRSKSPS